MAAAELVVTAVAASTPLGAGADASFAAARACIARFREVDPSPLRDAAGESVRVAASAALGFPDAPGARLRALVREAIADLAATLARDEEAAFAAGIGRGDPVRLDDVGLYLGVPTDDRTPAYATAAFEATDTAERALGLATGAAKVFALGHAAALRALEAAVDDVDRGAVPRALVGGVDSLVDPALIALLDARGRVASAARGHGFVPGEGAAFVMVEPLAAARARGARVLARVGRPATEREPIPLGAGRPTDAIGLATAAKRALAALAGDGPVLVVADVNGEAYRAQELGTALVRAIGDGAGSHRTFRVADTLGDTGAAAGALGLAFAAHALGGGRARAGRGLVLASSDEGLRGAVALAAPEPLPR